MPIPFGDQTTGDTYADVVVWKWNRSPQKWVAKLKDGTELRVERQRFGRRTFWNVVIWGDEVNRIGPFPYPDAGQKAAFAWWASRNGIKHEHVREACFRAGDCDR